MPMYRVILSVFLLLPSLNFAQENGALRLVGGDTENEGRLEVYYDGQWGTICDDSFNWVDANVLCNQMGFERAARLYYRAGAGRGDEDQPIWIDQINCPNGAASILDCKHNGWGVHNCEHREDAGVKCRRREPTKPPSMPIRLACPRYTQTGSCKVCPEKQNPGPEDCGPQVAAEGIIEALYNDVWRPVTAEGWSAKSARVACGQLGFPFAYGTPSLEELWTNWDGLYAATSTGSGGGSPVDPFHQLENDAFRMRLEKTYLEKLDCTGRERQLLDCYFPGFGPLANPSLQVATVRCGFLPHSSCYSTSVEAYRTRGSPVPWMGRAEVRLNGEWGTICDRQWSSEDANVFCRGMGYGTASSVTYRATHGRGTGKIFFNNLRCTGGEVFLSQCEGDTEERGILRYCGHHGDAGVVCHTPAKCKPSQQARIKQVPDERNQYYLHNYVQLQASAGWGMFCYGSMQLMAARVVCRETLGMFAARIRRGTDRSHLGISYVGNINCKGDETSVRDCNVQVTSTPRCPSGHTIVDCTPALPDLVPDLDYFRRSFYGYVDRLPMYYLRCALEENCLSSSANGQSPNHIRRLLRFDSYNRNWGTVDFQPILRPSEWIWHSCHGHYHSFESFVHYDLLNVTTKQEVAEGHKASFCLEDSACEVGGYSRYSCARSHQGISANCGDLYGRHLDCQWIDITDVPSGRYIVRQIVNPERIVPETDFLNNEATCEIQYFKETNFVRLHTCELSDHCDTSHC